MRNSTIWPDMDPADRDTVSLVLNSQAQQIQAHENQLKAIDTGVQQITERQDRAQQEVSAHMSQLFGAQLQRFASRLDQLTPLQQTTLRLHHRPVSSPSPAIYLPRPARLAPPEKYSGESGTGGVHDLPPVGESGGLGYGKNGLEEQRSGEMKPDLTSVPAPGECPDLKGVPLCYHDLREVFSKTKAMSLPPHRPWDCPIDLLPGAPIPKARLYAISGPERKAMDDYIKTSLQSGIIRPSSSAAGVGFFFVEKKDGSLRPCIDYSALNDVTIKNRYPLPLISSAFELLQQARIFTKLDLRNAYHLVRIRKGDEWKTGFNTPTGHYEYLVMPFGLTNAPAVFQGFINEVLREYLNDFVFVYLDDILIFSPDPATHQRHVRQVLNRLLENKLFVKAEKCEFHASSVTFLGFVVSPNCIQDGPREDPKLQFIVEVDASNEGVGAVLSQRAPKDNRIHPCAFLSRKLSSAERNYDVGNRELLAIKVALEEWRHWLEGAEQPFIVWMDHKNLGYLKSAKRLNSRQARWALFFSRFRFTLSYRPGSQNAKPDTLSRLYDPEPAAKEPGAYPTT
ncbi:hypothetical protein L3Q82_012950 [Scortum barcoo]|uniref:Uncharacterized protein n=1 Tax=Scortum barcoo TaxID=214431 RepID=A0ACB8W0H8_9TELE|nr:hypothetical protein L3Q82_012950 [Scortum barcoo]